MAETSFVTAGPASAGMSTGGSGGIDLGQLIPGLLGVGGAGIGIAGGIAGQQQVQGQFDVARSQYQLLLSLFNLYNAQQQGFNQMQLAAYQQQVAQALQDYQNKQQVFQQNQQIEQQRLGIANRLQDPAQVAAGAQGYLNPFLSTMEDRTAQALQRNLVEQGLASGGAVNQAVANAETGVLGQAYQQALANYLGTQQGALSALSPMGYAPFGPYTPGPPAPATALGRSPNVPAAPTGSPLGAAGGGLAALGPAVSALLQGLGLAPNQYQQLLRALGIQDTGGSPGGGPGGGADTGGTGGAGYGGPGTTDPNAGVGYGGPISDTGGGGGFDTGGDIWYT